MKKALVCGAGGFIGSHLVKYLVAQGHWVRGVDLKYSEFSETHADDFIIGDLRDPLLCRGVVDQHFDEVYQLAADMGERDLFSPERTMPILCLSRQNRRFKGFEFCR